MSRLAAILESDRPLVMGILNVTPDSFFDGGRYAAREAALLHAERMVAAGADIIDIGGESTRPGAAPVSADEELERVLPLVQQIRDTFDVAISVDTSKPRVMASVIEADIDLVNDVRALQEPGALDVVAGSDVAVCLMHMQGEPRTMQKDPVYEDVVLDIDRFFRERIAACENAGIARGRLILDVGFGFGKTPRHNLTLVNRLGTFAQLGMPLLVGLSRKSTIGAITEDRLTGSIAGALAALSRGARILRVHDVAETVSAVNVWRSIEQEKLPDDS